MDRRTLLTTAAAAPIAALAPISTSRAAAIANGTDGVWHTLRAAEAAYTAAEEAFYDAQGRLEEQLDDAPTVDLPRITGGEPCRVTTKELRRARETDPMLRGPNDSAMALMRDMIEKEERVRALRTPEAIAEREALYDRLETELAEKEAARSQARAPLDPLREKMIAAERRMGEADEAFLAAPVLTVEDAARKLEEAMDHLDPEDWSRDLVANALAGLRGLTA